MYEPLGFERLASAFSEQRPTRQAPVTVMLTYKGGTPLAQLADWAVESAYVTSDGSAHFLGPWSEAADQALRNYRAAARAGAVDAQNDDAFIRAIAAEISSGEDGPILRAIKKANEPDLERDWAAKPVLTRFLDPSEAPPSVLGRLVRTPIQIKTAGDSTASGEEAVRVRTADGVSVAVPASPGRSAVIVAFLPPGGQVIVEVIHSSGANDDRGRPIGIRTLGTFNSAKFRVDDSKGERLSLTVSDRLLASVDLAERDLIEVADLHIEPAGQQVGS